MQESGVVAGIDWAAELHAVCILGGDGGVIEHFDVTHDSQALRVMVSRFRKAGVAKVAIERGDGPVVQVLIDAGLAVFVVPSRQIKALRTRYGSAGNKDDRLDAYVLADTLRTDGHRWRPLREDHPETKALRAMCRARKDLVETRVQVMNQLRANLELAFPGALGLFSRPDSPITLAFLRRFPTAAKAAWLSPARLDRWLRSAGYSGGIAAQTLYRHLERAAPGLDGVEAEARGEITIGLVATIETLSAEIARIEAQIRKLFDAHPDQKIFASLPRSGMVRAATLLAEIGDCRERFPTDDALAALAGASPSTRQSGKHEQTVFRWSCNKKLRGAVMDFANGSRLGDEWAMQVYQRAIARGCRHPHAIRILARAWIRIIWRCWHDEIPFSPQVHTSRKLSAA
ncbi:IS110 family transposase [Rhodococcus sp. OK302]|uniref:IS110 family transposase n=1 Tax=Rhodococcus sp. OK302 TaxID=1882769 RepID=UPI000B94616E|nr:transposase IS116/IS110/IS902 family protein [Rhodococcus sp. OK302]